MCPFVHNQNDTSTLRLGFKGHRERNSKHCRAHPTAAPAPRVQMHVLPKPCRVERQQKTISPLHDGYSSLPLVLTRTTVKQTTNKPSLTKPAFNSGIQGWQRCIYKTPARHHIHTQCRNLLNTDHKTVLRGIQCASSRKVQALASAITTNGALQRLLAASAMLCIEIHVHLSLIHI